MGRMRRDKLNDIRRAVESMRSEPPAAPDFTSSILSRVHEQRPFLCSKTQRCLHLGRMSIGLSVAVVVFGVALAHRYAPGKIDLVAKPTPFSRVLQHVQTEADLTVTQFRTTLDSVAEARPSQILSVVAFSGTSADEEIEIMGPPVPLSAVACPGSRGLASCIGPRAECCRLKPAVAPKSSLAPLEVREVFYQRTAMDDFATLSAGPASLDVAAPK